MTITTREGSRKLRAFFVTQAALLSLAGMVVHWAPEAAIGGTLSGICGTMSLTFLYYCGGNVGEHIAKRKAAKS